MKILPIKIIKKGFIQNSVINKITNIEILITEIKEGFEVYKHEHCEDQIGYCFYGEFNFFINKKIKFFIKENGSYHISGNLIHHAFIDKTIYALDLKFKNNDGNKVCKENVFKNLKMNNFFKIDFFKSSNFAIEVYSSITKNYVITKNLNLNNEYYIICANEFSVFAGESMEINKFDILHIAHSKLISLSTQHELNTFVIIEIIH